MFTTKMPICSILFYDSDNPFNYDDGNFIENPEEIRGLMIPDTHTTMISDTINFCVFEARRSDRNKIIAPIYDIVPKEIRYGREEHYIALQIGEAKQLVLVDTKAETATYFRDEAEFQAATKDLHLGEFAPLDDYTGNEHFNYML